MIVKVELVSGPEARGPVKADMAKNIAALERAIEGKPWPNDFVLMIDTKSILLKMMEELPNEFPNNNN